MKRKILFIGAYGIENAGDDLPMLVMIDNLKENAKDIGFEFHALTRHINLWEKEKYGVIYHKNLEYENRQEAKDKWFQGLNFNDDRNKFYNFLNLIKEMDILVIGAGNFIIDISIDIFKGPIPLIWWYIHLAKLYDKKVFLYGISTAELTNEYAKLLTKEIILKSDIITVRDKNSKEYLKKLGVGKKIKVLPDPTLGIQFNRENLISDDIYDFLSNDNQIKIAFGLRKLDFLKEKKSEVFQIIIEFINSNPNYKYIFIPQSTYFEDDDRVLAKEISKSINKNIEYYIIEERYTPFELIKIYSLCNVTIAIRLHSAVFSQIAEVPAIAISYLPKVKSFMKDYGTQENIINIKEINTFSLDKKVKNILGYEIEYKNRLKTINKNKRKKVDTYSKLLLSLIK